MTSFWAAYLLIMSSFLGGLIGPGPDFVMIIRNSTANTRRSGILTATGLGLGVLTHATYALFGLGVVFQRFPMLIHAVKYCGAAYITYIAIGALRSKKRQTTDMATPHSATGLSDWQALRMGYMTNILNPHAATFILSILISAQAAPMLWKASYALSLCFSAVIWYGFVAVFLTNTLLRERFLGVSHIIDRIAGGVLLALAARLILTPIALPAG